ncbi:hypothetical protein [Tumebacillus permanentifrigoris]|uniref:Uncharacterized protein n=1 Tax=Tumebacillus permanentifrigoris TaxID=378543 RepID=A0A316D8E8_9BACL|nr:hypothetical protein [Tumebacillus permanentifrigoris]PWK10198.1 hypothetical protein C7459_11219 [Tumebacillus permanentifrigoris]
MTLELVSTQNYVSQVAISPEQALHAYQALRQITKQVLVEGTDYGIIPGTPKPSLYKPGAENLLRFYSLGHTVEKVSSTEDWENGFFYFEYKVTVHKQFPDGTKITLSECVGSANSREPKYYKKKNGDLRDPYEQVNTFQKMAIKRALVGATLQATGASGLFTQDIEDMDPSNFQSGGQSNGGGSRGNYSGNGNNSNNSGNKAPGEKQQVINNMKPMGLNWNDLSGIASAALGREIKKVVTDVKDDEWKTVLDYMNRIKGDGEQQSDGDGKPINIDDDDLPF